LDIYYSHQHPSHVLELVEVPPLAVGNNLEGDIGYDILQTSILVLQVFHAADITYFHSAVLSFSIVKGEFAYAKLPANLFHCSTHLMILKNDDYLRLQ